MLWSSALVFENLIDNDIKDTVYNTNKGIVHSVFPHKDINHNYVFYSKQVW